MLGSLYILIAGMLVVGSLIVRREPIAKLLVMAIAWVALFGAGFVLFTFRDDLGFVLKRLHSEATGAPMVEAGQLRIPQAIDGHFYVDAMLNGRKVRFLVDSGATTTTIGRLTAAQSQVAVSSNRDRRVMTGNGVISVASGRARSFDIGNIHRDDVGLNVGDSDELNVLGMNYLSTLSRWGVQGRWLIFEG